MSIQQNRDEETKRKKYKHDQIQLHFARDLYRRHEFYEISKILGSSSPGQGQHKTLIEIERIWVSIKNELNLAKSISIKSPSFQ